MIWLPAASRHRVCVQHWGHQPLSTCCRVRTCPWRVGLDLLSTLATGSVLYASRGLKTAEVYSCDVSEERREVICSAGAWGFEHLATSDSEATAYARMLATSPTSLAPPGSGLSRPGTKRSGRRLLVSDPGVAFSCTPCLQVMNDAFGQLAMVDVDGVLLRPCEPIDAAIWRAVVSISAKRAWVTGATCVPGRR